MQHQVHDTNSSGFLSLLNRFSTAKRAKQQEAQAYAQRQAIERDDHELLAFLERL